MANSQPNRNSGNTAVASGDSATSEDSQPTFADQLFSGRFDAEQLMPYFEQSKDAQEAGDKMVAKTKTYCDKYVFPDRIDKHSLLAPGIIKGLGNHKVLGMNTPCDLGGGEMSVTNFCRVMETIGGHCGSTAAMARMQTCTILKILQQYGTPTQQEKWMPPIMAGDQTGALAVTEELAGSDINNVHTAASPKESGNGFELTGEKRWVANGEKAELLIVLARTPDAYGPAGNVSAFLVPSDAPGITITPVTKNKLGLKGITVAAIDFKNVSVSKDDMIGGEGNGVDIVRAIATLDQIVYAATTVGQLKALREIIVTHARTRTQFGKTISNFDQVKKKIANVAANLYALEAALYHTASHYQCDQCDSQRATVEAEMLKLFASESAWDAINQTMDVCGGKSVFNDEPLERLLRDIRHSLIAEGSNDVLRQTIAASRSDSHNGDGSAVAKKTTWLKTAGSMLPTSPTIEVKHEHLRFHSRWLANQISKFGSVCKSHADTSATSGLTESRIADFGTRLFLSSCVFAKLSALMVNGTIADPEKRFEFDTGALFLQQSKQANQRTLDLLKVNLDDELTTVADHWLGYEFD